MSLSPTNISTTFPLETVEPASSNIPISYLTMIFEKNCRELYQAARVASLEAARKEYIDSLKERVKILGAHPSKVDQIDVERAESLLLEMEAKLIRIPCSIDELDDEGLEFIARMQNAYKLASQRVNVAKARKEALEEAEVILIDACARLEDLHQKIEQQLNRLDFLSGSDGNGGLINEAKSQYFARLKNAVGRMGECVNETMGINFFDNDLRDEVAATSYHDPAHEGRLLEIIEELHDRVLEDERAVQVNHTMLPFFEELDHLEEKIEKLEQHRIAVGGKYYNPDLIATLDPESNIGRLIIEKTGYIAEVQGRLAEITNRILLIGS